MRADRLLSILLLLQARGRMTAPALAAELEVSTRTIYRDIDALSVSGVPIFGEPGPNGGYSLIDSYRTSLTGLTDGEVRALFMLSVPAPLADLGLRTQLQSALRKFAAALPAERQEEENRVRGRIHVDSIGWQTGRASLPYLATLYEAIWSSREIDITYAPLPMATLTQRVEPYALVAKAGEWYLVFRRAGLMRALQVADLRAAYKHEEVFVRVADFDLVGWWQEWCREQEALRGVYSVTLRIAPDYAPYFPATFGEPGRAALDAAGPPDAAGRVTLTLAFGSLFDARDRLLALGRAVEVLAPYALRRSLADTAEQIAALYGAEMSTAPMS